MLETSLIIAISVVTIFSVSSICFEIRRSRCTEVNCCGCKVKRTLMSQESLDKDKRPELPSLTTI